MPGLAGTDPHDYDESEIADTTNGTVRRRVFRPRFDPARQIAQTVAKGVKGAVSAATTAIRQTATNVVGGSPLANPEVRRMFGVDLGPTKFGEAALWPDLSIVQEIESEQFRYTLRRGLRRQGQDSRRRGLVDTDD
ncbi:hypothetical protein PG994_002713 [Apiospora phragmitis]|uniref:HK97 gp10 family phage protein n=1 Tax=Apiospora phragmitis TaxID=2905665 RepID=A0ABR1W8P6_9PEZI